MNFKLLYISLSISRIKIFPYIYWPLGFFVKYLSKSFIYFSIGLLFMILQSYFYVLDIILEVMSIFFQFMVSLFTPFNVCLMNRVLNLHKLNLSLFSFLKFSLFSFTVKVLHLLKKKLTYYKIMKVVSYIKFYFFAFHTLSEINFCIRYKQESVPTPLLKFLILFPLIFYTITVIH